MAMSIYVVCQLLLYRQCSKISQPQGAHTRSAMSNRGPHAAQSKVLCGPVQVLAVVKISYILTTCPYFHNLQFEILMQVV